MSKNSGVQILPVIHFHNHDLALQQVEIARICGADGVFLISHNARDADLLPVAAQAKQLYPDFKVGINFLTDGAIKATKKAVEMKLDMVWDDNMGVDSNGGNAMADLLANFAREYPAIEFFASVAFKYRPYEPDPPRAAINAQALGFMPTTSGSGTGSAPELEKIIAMSGATGGQLAIASGMTPENVAQYAPYLRHILVATGVGLDEYRIDPVRLNKLIVNSKTARAGAV